MNILASSTVFSHPPQSNLGNIARRAQFAADLTFHFEFYLCVAKTKE